MPLNGLFLNYKISSWFMELASIQSLRENICKLITGLAKLQLHIFFFNCFLNKMVFDGCVLFFYERLDSWSQYIADYYRNGWSELLVFHQSIQGFSPTILLVGLLGQLKYIQLLRKIETQFVAFFEHYENAPEPNEKKKTHQKYFSYHSYKLPIHYHKRQLTLLRLCYYI